MKTILVSALAIALMAFAAKDKLTGRWESRPSANGNVTGVVFTEDGSFTGFRNDQPFVRGTYTLKDSVFTLSDNGCNGVEGVYKAVFFSNDDSLRFEAVADDCTQRKASIERTALGRVKQP